MEAPTLAELRPGPGRLWSLALWEARVHPDGHHRERNDRSDVESIKRTAGRFGQLLKFFEFFLCFILSFTKESRLTQVCKLRSYINLKTPPLSSPSFGSDLFWERFDKKIVIDKMMTKPGL